MARSDVESRLDEIQSRRAQEGKIAIEYESPPPKITVEIPDDPDDALRAYQTDPLFNEIVDTAGVRAILNGDGTDELTVDAWELGLVP